MTVTEQLDRKHQEDLERIRNFRLMDDDFMTKCFEDKASVELVLQIVMEMPGLKVLDVRTQVFVENVLNRSVRFDVLATDSEGRKIDIEIQRSDRGAAPKRARYNSSMLDTGFSEKGGNFEDLPDTWVIFITENDVMGGGFPLYHVERRVREMSRDFQDGSYILYVNGAYRGDTPIGKLMHDFSCTDPADMNYGVLAGRVKFFKESEKGVSIMCKAMEDMRLEEREEGRKEGRKERNEEIAASLLKKGKLGLEDIADATELSIDKLKQIQASMGI